MQKQKYNYSKLKGRIVEIFGSQRAFSESIGEKAQNVSRAISLSYFNHERIALWAKALQIDYKDIGLYFFVPKE